MVVLHSQKIHLRRLFILVASKLFTFYEVVLVLVASSVGLFEIFYGFCALRLVLGQVVLLLFRGVVLHELGLIKSIDSQFCIFRSSTCVIFWQKRDWRMIPANSLCKNGLTLF